MHYLSPRWQIENYPQSLQIPSAAPHSPDLVMAPSSTTAGRIDEARGLVKSDPSKAESTLKEILAQGPGSSEASSRDYENALVLLGELYRDQKKPHEIAELIKTSRDSFSSFAKAKTAKLGMLD